MARPRHDGIETFLGGETLALAGVSRSGRGYGNRVLRDLTAKGYRVLPVHPVARELGGHRAYPSLGDLPGPVDGLVLVVPPEQSERLVREALAAGIRRVWMQPGAESEEAVTFCRRHGMEVIAGRCILVLSRRRGG